PLRLVRSSFPGPRAPSGSTPFPYTTLFRSHSSQNAEWLQFENFVRAHSDTKFVLIKGNHDILKKEVYEALQLQVIPQQLVFKNLDRKSTRLNSSHVKISYAVFCLKKKRQGC